MKLMTWNIRSWYRDIKAGDKNWLKRAKRIKNYIAYMQPDVICLQEALAPMTGLCIPKGYAKATGLSVSHHVYYLKSRYYVLENRYRTHYAEAVLLPKGELGAVAVRVISVHGHWNSDKADRICESVAERMRIAGAMSVASGDWNIGPFEATSRMGGSAFALFDGGDTFRNWKDGSQGVIDFSVVNNSANGSALTALSLDQSMDYSDHRPVFTMIYPQ